MDISAAGSAIYSSFGSSNADSLTGSIRKAADTDRQSTQDPALQATQAASSFGGSSSAGGSVTPDRGQNLNIVV
ncbi:hypothetical protein [Azospirillum sp.]|uniref:hypothetical protein n=1 Tax=Azospirillum sp. TaxID=34012 RepID=UPI002D34A2E9|nr:hypothetical protein [Azospirillum sp.]HYD70209.1 hypothetical protein [Azospirillum sp.]